jgi:hypothetical protein
LRQPLTQLRPVRSIAGSQYKYIIQRILDKNKHMKSLSFIASVIVIIGWLAALLYTILTMPME